MTGPRKKKESATDFIPTPDKQSEIPSGFCMTGHHDKCKYVFIYGKCETVRAIDRKLLFFFVLT